MAVSETGFERDELPDLFQQIAQDINDNADGVDARVPGTRENGLAWALAGAAHLFYSYAERISEAVIPDATSGELLERWVSFFGLSPRTAAQAAAGEIVVAGDNGEEVEAGDVFVRKGDGAEFVATATVVIAAGIASVPVEASEPGAAGNSAGATIMELLEPIEGVESVGAVSLVTPITGGTDEESDADLLARLRQHARSRPQGGAEADYEAWALAVEGVGRAWVFPLELGAGTVVVRFVLDDGSLPGAGEVEDVQEYIDARRPVTAAVTVAAPVSQAVELTITPDPADDDTKDAIEAELVSLFIALGEPGGTIKNSVIRAAISQAAGEAWHTLDDVDGDGDGLSDVVIGATAFPVPDITWGA